MYRIKLSLAEVWTYLGPIETASAAGKFKLAPKDCDCEISDTRQTGIYFVELCTRHKGLAPRG